MALSQEKKGTIAVSLTNFLDSGCIVASGVALAAWAIAFNFDNVWVSILGAVGANAFGAAVGIFVFGGGVVNTGAAVFAIRIDDTYIVTLCSFVLG